MAAHSSAPPPVLSVEDAASVAVQTGHVPENTAHAAAEHEAGGLPQFEAQHWFGQIVYLLILFFVLYLLVAKIFAPRMRKVMDERADTIANAVAAARQVQAEAAAQAAAAQAEVAKARADARATAAAAKARVTEEATPARPPKKPSSTPASPRPRPPSAGRATPPWPMWRPSPRTPRPPWSNA